MRLNRKRKKTDEREADKERSKKICLERSAAKTLLTLHRHTGKSKEEHKAAGTLLDLSLESVVSAEEAEIEDLQDMEKQIIDQFPETLGTLSKDDDDGSENVVKKMNLRSFKLNRVYLDPPNMSNAGDFSWS